MTGVIPRGSALDSLTAGLLFSEFANALDTKNWQAYAELFVPDGLLHLPGADPVQKNELASVCQAVLGGFSDTHHMITNVISTPGSMVNHVTANLRATHFYPDSDREPWIVIGRYIAKTLPQGDAVLFQSVELVMVWQTGEAPTGM
ncbi:MAG: nuclear transport factor 2 family protein [Candidatus Leucobacter sulfamidivorax]|nr:nuclear transport factor 2 family protein [Candidatus Leucobacter sulfamidivorax]